MSVSNVKPIADPPVLWIDSNEERKRAHSELLVNDWATQARRVGFDPEVKHLSVGDFRMMVMGYVWVVERKAVPSDIEASFTDGRLNLQYWKAQDEGIERLVLLLEGDPNTINPVLRDSVMHTIFELQALGGFVLWCKQGETIMTLKSLYDWLNRENHAYLTKMPIPVPGMFTYINKDLRTRVITLMTFAEITEKTAKEVLSRYTLMEVFEKPLRILEVVPTVRRSGIRKMYHHLQLEMPDEVADYLDAGQQKNRVVKIDRTPENVIELSRGKA